MAPVLRTFVVIIWINMLYTGDSFPSLADFSVDNIETSKQSSKPSNCPLICSCDEDSYNVSLNCEFRKLKEFPSSLPYFVSYLTLAGNEIIYLFYNSSLQSLQYLNISKNELSKIDYNWLKSLTNLRTLDLSYNALSTTSNIEKLQNRALEYLDLSKNKLSQITGNMFSDINNLRTLNLSFNELEKIGNDSFKYLYHLNILDLNSNKLNDLQHEWFKSLQSLHTLNLSNNKLSILKNVVFFSLKNLEKLDLSNNFIKSVGLLSFKGLTNLNFLNLSYNNVFMFPNGIFRPLVSLETIDLSNNKFSDIDNFFVYTKNLKYLYLKKLSNLKYLTPYSLSGLHKLEVLELSYSNLSSIDIKAFYEVQNLLHLDLSHAKLKSLKMGLFKNLNKLETIKLNVNPWTCDCYLYWLLIWLGEHTNTHLIEPSETFCDSPTSLKNHVVLDALDLSMVCTNATIPHYTTKTKFKIGLPALLECQVEGNPLPSLTWLTPQNGALLWNTSQNKSTEHMETNSDSSKSINLSSPPEDDRFYLMPNGNLAIKNVERGDGGFYVCIASNPLNYVSVSIRLTLDYEYFVHIKIISVLVGMATSFGFLLLTLVYVLIKTILNHFGIKCPCRSGSASPRTQQIKKILESMEHYKKQQLDRLRDNYNGQVVRIKDNCMQQMERLRESYSSQAERIRDIKEYGTLQIDRIRDNYYSQVQRVRDYSASQIIRLRENYIFQRNRIRKFSAHHLYKLRENYKVQQQHFNKILENLNIESCRNVCQRTESVIFEPEILENVLVPKICLQTFNKEICDSNDTSSQISAYFTPEEAGSEISGHDSDELESLDPIAILESTDLKSPEEGTSNSSVPEKESGNAKEIESNELTVKSANETIV